MTLLGPMYLIGHEHLGWILWILVPGSLPLAILVRGLGVRHARGAGADLDLTGGVSMTG